MSPHLTQPCDVALVRALIWGLYPDEVEGFVNFNMFIFFLVDLSHGLRGATPFPRLGSAVDHGRVTAWYHIMPLAGFKLRT